MKYTRSPSGDTSYASSSPACQARNRAVTSPTPLPATAPSSTCPDFTLTVIEPDQAGSHDRTEVTHAAGAHWSTRRVPGSGAVVEWIGMGGDVRQRPATF